MPRVPAPRAPRRKANGTNVSIYLPLPVIKELDARVKSLEATSRSMAILDVLLTDTRIASAANHHKKVEQP